MVCSRLLNGGGGGGPLRLLLAALVLAVALLGLGGRAGAANGALAAARHSKREAAAGPAVTFSGRFLPGPSADGVARLPQVGAPGLARLAATSPECAHGPHACLSLAVVPAPWPVSAV